MVPPLSEVGCLEGEEHSELWSNQKVDSRLEDIFFPDFAWVD